MQVKRQPLASRLLWFIAGGLLSTGLNAGPFRFLSTRGGMPEWAAYAISLTVATSLFSIWNYYLNFRTRRAWNESFVRYLGAVGICTALNYAVVVPSLPSLRAIPHGWLLVIMTAQIGMGGVKFLLYHYWVYPRHCTGPGQP